MPILIMLMKGKMKFVLYSAYGLLVFHTSLHAFTPELPKCSDQDKGKIYEGLRDKLPPPAQIDRKNDHCLISQKEWAGYEMTLEVKLLSAKNHQFSYAFNVESDKRFNLRSSNFLSIDYAKKLIDFVETNPQIISLLENVPYCRYYIRSEGLSFEPIGSGNLLGKPGLYLQFKNDSTLDLFQKPPTKNIGNTSNEKPIGQIQLPKELHRPSVKFP